MADDAADLKPEKDARRPEVQHDKGEIAVLDLVEVEVLAGQQERVTVPPRGAVRRRGMWRSLDYLSAFAVSALIEMTSPPVSTTK